jgi:aminoglycoside phosphotransferase (APT) family kinase protein
MHAHTAEHSACSSVSAVELVRRVHAKGVQGIVLTDHHYLWPEDDLQQLRQSAAIPEYFLIVAGQEVSTADFGDVLVYGAGETLHRGMTLLEISVNWPEAALLWAHPYRNGRRPPDQSLLNPLFDGIEIFNSNHTARENSWGLRDWHRLRFTAIAGTDTHGASYAGTYPTLFDHTVSTVVDLASELRAGRCRPFVKEIPHAGANSQVTEVTIGTKGDDEQRQRIVIRTIDSRDRWRSADRAHRVMAEIGQHGFHSGSYRVPVAIDEDPATFTLIEQGVRGKSLYDKLLQSGEEDGRHYLRLTGEWLARLHNLELNVTPVKEFLPREHQRLANYLKRFTEIRHPQSRKAAALMEMVTEHEKRFIDAGCRLAQGHGDFHLKNVFIGQDSQEQRGTAFVAAIDFESSMVLPRAFDVGCFVAQYRNQFFSRLDIRERFPLQIFLDAYLHNLHDKEENFAAQIDLYRARTNLSIAAYLIRLGLGDSEELWRVLVEGEEALAHL